MNIHNPVGHFPISAASNPAASSCGPTMARRKAPASTSRLAARSKLDPAFRYTDYGFRVARDL